MAKTALPVFFRNPRTGFMKELAHAETEGLPLTRGEAGPDLARVLVADDDEADRLLTIWQLGDAWPNQGEMLVECAANGEEALEKIWRHRYALVVLDWSMPRQGGADVLRAIRKRNLRIPVVVLSDQRHEIIASELNALTAAYVNKAELDAHSFRNAIAASMQFQEGQGLDGSGPVTWQF